MLHTLARIPQLGWHELKCMQSRAPRTHLLCLNSKAPKARSIPAWGEAPCFVIPDVRGLKARPIPSIPQISLVALHPILLQERAEFFLKIPFAMMRLLCIDVLYQHVQIGRPDGKDPIASLPRERRQYRRLRLDPFRRRSFQIADQFCDVRSSRQPDCDMHMVRNASHAITLASGIAAERRKIRIQLPTDGFVENRLTAFRTEDHMHHDERKRQSHREKYRSGLQPSPVTRNTSWGFAPCWYSNAPSALCVEGERFLSNSKPHASSTAPGASPTASPSPR